MNTFYEVKIMNKKIIGIDLGGTSIKFAILMKMVKFKKNGLFRQIFWMKEAILYQILFNRLNIN